ncbi:MAG: GNAT family N-acetyltransferase, partial [Actinomycetota bacterium]|nr:GNAT family N-acetyltransferase [Actinomycetota bacterium]
MVERASGRLVGSAALRLPARNAAAEIGYAVYPTSQGRGYAAETARMLSDWAFGHGTARVQIRAAVRNLASIRSALRAGFRYEGTARAGVDTAFGPVDGAVFARLPEEDRGPVLAAFAPLPDAGLTDDVISLRPLRASDAGALYEMESDPQSRRWTFSAGGPTRAEMVAFAERAQLIWLVGGQASLAIVDRASAATAGTMTLRLAGPPAVGGIGYTVHPAFRGHG